MTFLVENIIDHLKGSSAILNAFSNRIFAGIIPQDFRDGAGNKTSAYPCVLINNISNDPEYILTGEAGTHTTRMQIDAWTDGTGGARKVNELAELLRNRLSGYKGAIGTGMFGSIRQIGHRELNATPADASDNYPRRISKDFEFIHTADVPTFA